MGHETRRRDEGSTLAPPPASIAAPARLSILAEPVLPAPEPLAAQPSALGQRLVPALLLITGLLGAIDLWLGLSGWLSVGVAGAWLLLAVPWSFAVAGGKARLERTRQPRAAWLVDAVIIALVFLVLGAKWLALWHGLEQGAEFARSYQTYTGLLIVLFMLGLLLGRGRGQRLVLASAEYPARLMVLSFTAAALLGALLLALPLSLRQLSDVSLLDSLFMSMSAVCVTGLTTVNVAETYSFAGQVVLVILMQVGGLGIMVLTAAVTMLAGRRLAVKTSAVLAEMVEAESLADLRRTILMIVAYTFVLEAVGAALLYLQFRSIPESELVAGGTSAVSGPGSAVWAAIFHAVSAFCNGSLSNFRDGMLPFASAPVICQTIALLIVLGGLGFPVIHELLFRVIARLKKQRPARLSLNGRIALATTGILLGLMAIAYFALERSASFSKLGFGDQLNAALFQSACARTSGFNVVDVSAMLPATLLLTCFAMFVGGDPGSTAGGVRTTTFAVLVAGLRGELSARRPQLFDRAIPQAVVRRAVGVAFLSVALLSLVVFLLFLFERQEPLALLFEAVSAFSTTGLSTGITAKLSAVGKLLLIATMLIGRVGPLTMALALSTRERLPAYELPEERVMIG